MLACITKTENINLLCDECLKEMEISRIELLLRSIIWHVLYFQTDDKNFRRGPSWRRQFPPREVHGISMMPGSSETLPAGFRLTTTSGHSRKMTTDGTALFLALLTAIGHTIL